LKQQTTALDARRTSFLFVRFSENSAHPDFKNPGKASPLLFHFGVRRAGRYIPSPDRWRSQRSRYQHARYGQ
jgi:hypothetical protein